MGGKFQIYNLLPRSPNCVVVGVQAFHFGCGEVSGWCLVNGYGSKLGRERDYQVGLYWVFQSIWGSISMILSHTQINQDSFPISFWARLSCVARPCHSNSWGALQELESLSSAQASRTLPDHSSTCQTPKQQRCFKNQWNSPNSKQLWKCL